MNTLKLKSKKAVGNWTWYLITAILIVLVIIFALAFIFKVDPLGIIKTLFPSFNMTQQDVEYTGLCKIKAAEWSSEVWSKPEMVVYISNILGTKECEGLKVQLYIYNVNSGYGPIKREATFNEFGNIHAPIFGLGGGETYYFTLLINGKKLLKEDGSFFEKSEEKEIPICDIYKSIKEVKFVKSTGKRYNLWVSGGKECMGEKVFARIISYDSGASIYVTSDKKFSFVNAGVNGPLIFEIYKDLEPKTYGVEVVMGSKSKLFLPKAE